MRSVTHIGKIDEPHIVLSLHIFAQSCFSQQLDKDSTVSVHVYSCRLCQTHLQHTKAHWATRLPTQLDMVHQVPLS